MAATNYYVDPNAGNDTTGDGSVVTPWQTVQHALDTITRDATNGDQINIKAGTADTLTASLTLATYGTPTNSARLAFRGYTSAANDGGIGEIDGAATYRIFAATNYSFMTFQDMKIGNCGANLILHLNSQIIIDNCEIHTNTTHGNLVSGDSVVANSWIHDTAGIYALSGGRSVCNYFQQGSGSSSIAHNTGAGAFGNIIEGYNTGVEVGQGYWAIGNTIIGTSNTNGIGLNMSWYTFAINNLIVDYDGTSGRGISNSSGTPAHLIANNATHNCTTGIDAAKAWVVRDNQALGADPFNDAANQDYTPVAGVNTAMPGLFRGSDDGANTGTTTQAQIGAAQFSAAGGGLMRVALNGGFGG